MMYRVCHNCEVYINLFTFDNYWNRKIDEKFKQIHGFHANNITEFPPRYYKDVTKEYTK